MHTRRGFIRIGAATVGSLALRPFGLLPAMAQGGPDYRALVCVFLFGGNDSNNSVIPMDDASYQAYQSSRAGLSPYEAREMQNRLASLQIELRRYSDYDRRYRRGW